MTNLVYFNLEVEYNQSFINLIQNFIVFISYNSKKKNSISRIVKKIVNLNYIWFYLNYFLN